MNGEDLLAIRARLLFFFCR